MNSAPRHDPTQALPPRGWLRATVVAAFAILFVGAGVNGVTVLNADLRQAGQQ